MSPSKKKSGRQRSRPKYRKRTKVKTPRPPESGLATGPTPAHREPDRRPPSIVVSLDPLAPIIVRSGRPMNAHTDADPAKFPPPSTVAGCLRTAWARAKDQPFGPALAQLRVCGPLLLRGNDRILAPKPADAVYFGHGKSARCLRATPQRFDSGVGTDLPDGLLPVQLTMTRQAVGKPSDDPAWWSWEDLLAFRRGDSVPIKQLSRNGWSPPQGDRRTHVSIDRTTGAAAAGQLFETEGLDLGGTPAAFRAGAAGLADVEATGAPDDTDGAPSGDVRLLARCSEALDHTLVHLGGKRRLAALEPEPEERWPALPEEWLEDIRRAGGLSLTLLTPGAFSSGYRPGWLDNTLAGSPPDAPGLRLLLRAASVGRWRPHSGWDLARRRPKPARKLVPAGATYWFEIAGTCDTDALAALWLGSICDERQDRHDGFGLALPGPWTPPADVATDS